MNNKVSLKFPLAENHEISIGTIKYSSELFILSICIALIGLLFVCIAPDWIERGGWGSRQGYAVMVPDDPKKSHNTPKDEAKNASVSRQKMNDFWDSSTIYSTVTKSSNSKNKTITSAKSKTNADVDSGSIQNYSLSGVPRVIQEFFLTRLEPLVKKRLSIFLLGLFFGSGVVKDTELTEIFQSVGLSHLLSASGFNVGIVARVLGVNRMRRFYFFRSLIVIGGLTGFSWLAGFTPPVVRSVAQLLYVLLARIFGRPAHPVLSVLVPSGILLLLYPPWRSSLSFWLSCLSSLGIVLFSKPPTRVNSLMLSGIPEDARTTLAASVFTVPLIALKFGTFTPISFMVNPFVLWMIPYWMLLALCIFAVQFLGIGFYYSNVAEICSQFFDFLCGVLQKVGNMPGAVFYLGSFRSIFGFCWLIGLFFIIFLRKKRETSLNNIAARLRTME